MSTFKKAGHGIVAHKATATLANVSVGDIVAVIGDKTVGHDTTRRMVGEVVAVDASLTADNCTVEYFGSKLLKQVASGAITAGNFVKAGTTKNTVVDLGVANGSETAPGLADAYGIAFNTAADGADVIVIPL